MAEARPVSRNADAQTEANEEFPPLFEARTRKQLRTLEKRRLTNLAKRVEGHMKDGNSRTKLQFLRKEMTSQLEECIKTHNFYCKSSDLDERPTDEWITQVENVTAMWYGRIEEYIRTVNRPPSAAPSHSGSSRHGTETLILTTNPASIERDKPLSMTKSFHSQTSLDLLDNPPEREQPRITRSIASSIASDYIDPFIEKQSEEALAHRLEQQKMGRELNHLRACLEKWQFDHDEENRKRCILEKSMQAEIEKQKRDLQEEKLARLTDKHKYEREKESDLEKMRRSFDERLAYHAEKTLATHAIPEDSKREQYNGARKKQPQPESINLLNPIVSGRPLYEEKDEYSKFSATMGEKEEKIPKVSNWSFDFKDNEETTALNTSEMAYSVFRLPKMDLRPFDGDPKNWQDFIAIFRDLVHNNPGLSTTQKMAMLRRCLTQEMRDGLGDTLSSPALYLQALQELESTYGHPQIVSRRYVQSLVQLQRVNNNDYNALLKFSQVVNGAVASLKNGGYLHELGSSSLLNIIATKLPPEVQSRWGRQIVKNHPVCLTLQDFSAWLNKFVKGEMMAKHCQIHLNPVPPVKQRNGAKTGRQSESKTGYVPTINAITQSTSSPRMDPSKAKKLICLLCKEDHRLGQCKIFIDKSLEDRMVVIRDHGCCLRCLSKGHLSRDCTSRKKCIIDNCGQAHHSLLHDAPRITSAPDRQANQNIKSILKQTAKSVTLPLNVATVSVEDDESCTVLQIVPITIEAKGKTLETFGFLDPGSQKTLIMDDAAEKLNLDGDEETAKLGTFHGEDPIIKIKKVNFNIQSRDGSRSFPVKQAFSVPRLNVNAQLIEWPVTKREWKYLNDVELPPIDASNVTVLIGRDLMRVHDVLAHRSPPDGTEAPDGILTHFGWSIVGPVPESLLKRQSYRPSSVGHISSRQHDEQLHEALSPDDQKALRILKDTLRHTGERYEVGLMLKNPEVSLPNNAEVAFRHFASLERRFKKQPAFAMSYAAVVNEYITAGHAKPVDTESPTTRGHIWYLPHHGVTTPSKPRKVRVVFNPSARFRGTSLNEQLYKGPDLLTSLMGILLRFWQRPFAISGDIQKMYHQVKVPHHQQSFLRFIWRDPGSDEDPKTFQMTVHVFGAVSSPTTCIYALRRTAEDFGMQYPAAAERVMNNIYVDNYLDSAETEREAIVQRREVTALLKLGGFNMVQWMSSSRPVLASVDESMRARAIDLNADPLPVERTLGILWDCQHDAFIFNSTTRTDVKTKRQVLQEIASIFDPLGFLVPIVVTAKILMQDIWRSGVGWDDPLPVPLLDTWTRWVSELGNISSLKIPRCFRRSIKPLDYELHVFTDASELGYAACVYLRAIYGPSQVGLSLIIAKSRVAPLRQLSIPRLELQGAVLGANLCATVVKELGPIASAVHYWCDSQTVLQWIHSTKCKYHAFVAHRVTDILDKSLASQWRHIPGELNPADDGSRGVSPAYFTTQHRWFRGPDFLLMQESAWPSLFSIAEPSTDDPEVAPAKWIGSIGVPIPHRIFTLIQTSSNLVHLKRVVAWQLRFLRNYFLSRQNISIPKARWLTAPELRDAQTLLIRVDQEHHFALDLQLLRDGKPVLVTSKLGTLTPFIDSSGILRVGGRIQHSSLPEDMKHPIILASTSQLAAMIIYDLHLRLTHAKTERLLHNLRLTYHVLQPRATIKRVIRPCFSCKQRDSQPESPLMGPLPASRLSTHQWPFTHVGIDYFGPLYVSMFRKTLKRYSVMFTCLDCRAVHLEIAESMDLDSFMMAFSRFTDRRGVPLVCYSDNGTNLVAGEQEIRDAIAQWNPEVLNQKMANQNIEWRFSPPASPHFGGSWERMIKSAKLAMRIVLNHRVVTPEVLFTVMTGVEALLNARPLTPVSGDPTEADALTPNHFLHGRPNLHLHAAFEAEPQRLSKRRWMDAQEILTHFWNRWMREYIPSLIERKKWLRPRRNLAVGDIVLMVMPNPKRNTWPIGRIVRVEPGSDGTVRSAEVEVTRAVPGNPKRKNRADIKIKKTRYVRSAHKLCLLEADQAEDVFQSENRVGNVTDSPVPDLVQTGLP